MSFLQPSLNSYACRCPYLTNLGAVNCNACHGPYLSKIGVKNCNARHFAIILILLQIAVFRPIVTNKNEDER